jgi:hypothetical protein
VQQWFDYRKPRTNIMKRFLALLFLLAGSALYAQNQAPALLHDAAHCLVTDPHNFLDKQTLSARELNLGFQSDAKTSLGDKYLYVVVFTDPGRSHGTIFDVRLKQQGHNHVYSVENSASFVYSAQGIEFPTPPVGGQWAQNQLIPAIQRIVHHKFYTAEMKYLLKPAKNVECESNVETK